MQPKSKLYYDLLEIIEKQEEMIKKQNEVIARLTNESLEKENMINELMQQEKKKAGENDASMGDKIAVVDKDEENEYFVTRQELEYTGALRARMSGRKA